MMIYILDLPKNKLEVNILFIDKFIEENTDVRLEDLSPIDKAIIRLAICEFLYREDIPEKVTINESISIAKKFHHVIDAL